MCGILWAIKHTVLALCGGHKKLLDNTVGAYRNRWALIRTVWRVRRYVP